MPQRPTWPVSSDEVDQREHVVDGVVVLGDAERPAHHRLVGPRVRVRRLANDIGGHAGRALAELERVGLDGGAVRRRSRSVALPMKASCASPAWMISRAIALASAMSLPTLSPSHTSAHWADAVRRGSIT